MSPSEQAMIDEALEAAGLAQQDLEHLQQFVEDTRQLIANLRRSRDRLDDAIAAAEDILAITLGEKR